MIRKLCTLVLGLAFVLCVCGCAENEYKTTEKKETTTESTPTDVSPGEMIVE
ncbi:MAG: hypothetical protein JXQ75_01915 [Phycisphaerae bacterium]|nr:hypothetical protein [Phycisphaerae bacterium]